MRKKVIAILLSVTMTTALLAGCGNSGSTSEPAPEQTEDAAQTEGTDAGTDEAPAEGDSAAAEGTETAESEVGGGEIKPGGTLKVGTVQSPSVVGFTPEITNNSFIQYLRCAYESLLYYDEAGNIVGQLASEWEADADTATLTFKLVDGVNFADGTPFNAEAVKWNIEKYIETGRSETNNIDSVEVVDDSTVNIKLKEWNSSSLEMIGFFIYYMSPTTFDEKGIEWMRANSCGTGPFVVNSFDQGVSIKYTKNENYHVAGQPYLDGIDYTIFGDSTTLTNALKAGEVDVLTYGNDCDVMKDLEGIANIVTDKNGNGLGVESVGIIPSSADESDPFYDAKVRQALCYAVDWDQIVTALSYGYYERTNQWAAPGAVTYNTDLKGYSYDPEKAKALLAEAGYADGFDTVIYAGNAGFQNNAATAISASLAEVGINASVEIIDGAKGNDMMANGWSGLYWHYASIGPDLGLYMGRHLDVNGAYYAKGIQHPQDCLDLLGEIRVAKDEKTKIDLEWQLQEKIYDEYALFGIPLYVNAPVHMRYDYVEGADLAKVHATTWSPATTWLNK